MKLNLGKLKEVLINEGDEDCFWINEWVKNNIGDEDVDVRKWLDEFDKYWTEWSDDYGDSGVIEEILIEDYKLKSNEVDYVMSIYWGYDDINEYRKDFSK